MRRENDAYYTPKWCVDLINEELISHLKISCAVEPAYGDGSVVRSLALPMVNWTAFDIVQPALDLIEVGTHFIQCDYLDLTVRNDDDDYADFREKQELVISNPPYNRAEEFITHSREMFPEADVIMLLRLGFLAGVKREAMYAKIGMPEVYVLPSRPSFTGDGRSDASDYAWMHWLRGKKNGRGSIRRLRTKS